MKWLVERFAAHRDKLAFVHNDRHVSYGETADVIAAFGQRTRDCGIRRGHKVVVVGDFSPEVVCLILALGLEGCIVIPLTRQSVVEEDVALSVAGSDWIAEFDAEGREYEIRPKPLTVENALLDDFLKKERAGLILFSSGSTGVPKGILHDLENVADKFRVQRAPMITIPFLMIDHFGGINTILAITSSLGTVVTVAERSIAKVAAAIERYRVELLPVTPSFLNMMLMTRAHEEFDLSSIQRITYGTEVMPQVTLDRLRVAFPDVQLQQTYGLSEVGVLRSQSRPDGSLWVRIGGEGFQTQVRDDVLWIKSDYRMEGYLNAPSGFDQDGWFNTQDRVQVDGEWFRILGRVTDIINVGGQKVYPVEVEDVILGLDNIEDVAVYGEHHDLLGQIVVAKVRTRDSEPVDSLKRRIRLACHASLTNYKAPSKVVLSSEEFNSVRQKKVRKSDPPSSNA
ncbi:class I adenylate-forming enzyme family protein [Methylorubrum extorquens]|uniref:class I adenylate-forming enzyme family protein n=1 Tax=Methylorubrum extorquens TaxID=408 RepID=UPI001EE5ED08|nr:class I adenylate-forming enzyme family protein [Methylorubrum extorquens]MCG5247838.1 acyl--CoA ligase [Methylorubrum extorquens]